MEILQHDSNGDHIISATDDTGSRRTTGVIPGKLTAIDSPVRDQVAELKAVANVYVAKANDISARFKPSAGKAELLAEASKLIGPVVGLVSAAQGERRSIDEAWQRILSVSTADATTSALRQQDRTVFASLSVAQKVQWLNDAAIDQLEAIIEGGERRAGVSNEVWARIEEKYAKLNFVRMSKLSDDHTVRPSFERPLATGVDEVALDRAASEVLGRHRGREQFIEASEMALQGIASVVAVTCGITPKDAFDFLTSKDKAA